MKLSPEQIKKRLQKLPEDLKDAIFSEENTTVLLAIGKKYNLPIDKIGELSTATNYIILGAIKPGEYIAELAKRLEVDKEVARKIAHDVNEKIFSKIRESLKKIHKIDETSTSPEAFVDAKLVGKEPAVAKAMAGKEKKIPMKVPQIIKPQDGIQEKKEPEKKLTVEAPAQKIEKPPADAKAMADKPAAPETPEKREDKTPFEKKISGEVFRTPKEESEKVEEELESAKKEDRYPGGEDPYREPIE